MCSILATWHITFRGIIRQLFNHLIRFLLIKSVAHSERKFDWLAIFRLYCVCSSRLIGYVFGLRRVCSGRLIVWPYLDCIVFAQVD